MVQPIYNRLSILRSLPNSCSPGSAAVGGKFFYDIDGKVPYSYYERRPELYDLDGKHRFDPGFVNSKNGV